MHLDIDEIAENLQRYYPTDNPVAIVINAGYRGKERIVHGTLATIQDKIKGEKLPAHLVYVGNFLNKRYGIDEIVNGSKHRKGKRSL
ncbi:hypothetical protein [Trichloromonas sp.]|uniref:hypothetical protein n=1 Tax=Trichloromonas sp. TaxID=3069249 RepID=UPI003D81BE8D